MNMRPAVLTVIMALMVVCNAACDASTKDPIALTLQSTMANPVSEECREVNGKELIANDLSIAGCNETMILTVSSSELFVHDVAVALNGQPLGLATTSKQSRHIELKTIIRLRPFSNELRVDYKSGEGRRLKLVHVYRDATIQPRRTQWVLIVEASASNSIGQRSADFQSKKVKAIEENGALLESSLIALGNTHCIRVPAISEDEIKDQINDVRQQLHPGDKLLIYILGEGGFGRNSRLPFVWTREGDGSSRGVLDLVELFAYLGSLRIPSLAVVLDVNFVEPSSNLSLASSVSSVQQNRPLPETNLTSAPWLVGLDGIPAVDILFNGRITGDDSGNQDPTMSPLTQAVIEATKARRETRGGPCEGLVTLIEIVRSIAQNGAEPIFYSTAKLHDTFCFNGGDAVDARIEAGEVDASGLVRVHASLPTSPDVSSILLSASGVPIARERLTKEERAQSTYILDKVIPVSEGRNWIQVEALTSGGTYSSGMKDIYWAGLHARDPMNVDTLTSPSIDLLRPTFDLISRDNAAEGMQSVDHVSVHSSGTAADLPKLTNSVENDPFIPGLIVNSDRLEIDTTLHSFFHKSITYEIANNGVVVWRSVDDRVHKTDIADLNHEISLVVGDNRVIVRAMADGTVTEKSLLVRRELREHIIGVAFGIDQYSDDRIPELRFAASDAVAFRLALLQYTSGSTNDITAFVNRSADEATLRAAFGPQIYEHLPSRASGTNLKDVESETTLIVYFAGYGVTTPTANGGEQRCLIPADARLNTLAASCVSTNYIEQQLGLMHWKNVILILDTSYGGPSSRDFLFSYSKPEVADSANSGIPRVESRTLQTYYSTDASWRSASGIARDRVLLVSSGTNEPSLASSEYGHGVFTSALLATLKSRLQPAQKGNERIAIQDMFSEARDLTQIRSRQVQTPIMKGSLSEPFSFRTEDLEALRKKWAKNLQALRQDTLMMRVVKVSQIDEAEMWVQKGEELYPGELLPLMGRAIVLKYQSGLCQPEAMMCANLYRQGKDTFSKITAEYEKALNSQTSTFSDIYFKSVISNSLMSEALLLEEGGELDEASKAVKKAEKLFPNSARVKFTLAEIYFAEGNLKEGAKVLDEILNVQSTGKTTGLSVEEQGRAVIWRAAEAYLLRDSNRAHLLLESYARRNTITGRIEISFSKSPVGSVLHRENVSTAREGKIREAASWPFEVSNYLLGDRRDDELDSYERLSALRGASLDPSAFLCQASFYKGVRYMSEGRYDPALSAFNSAVSTNKSQFPEFWAAKYELRVMSSRGRQVQ